MPVSSWMLTLLADETRRHHSAADGDRLVLMERSNVDRYRSCLEQIYCFEQPIEAALARTPGFDPSLLRTHLKTNLLENDLRRLGGPLHCIARPAGAFEDTAEALGWLYVLHRNTLCHGLVLRQLTMLMPDAMDIAGSYLSAFEGVAGARMWELGLVIDRAARRDNAARRVIDGANEALRHQRHWYSCGSMHLRAA